MVVSPGSRDGRLRHDRPRCCGARGSCSGYRPRDESFGACAVGAKKRKQGKKRAESVKDVTVKEPEQRKRAKRADKTLYKHAGRAVEMTKKFPNQSLVERKGLLFCVACDDYVSFKEAVSVKQHVFGQQKKGEKAEVKFAAKTEAEKMTLKHYARLAGLAAKEVKATLVEAPTEVHRKDIFTKSAGMLSMKGATLPQETTTDRVFVHMTLLDQGIRSQSSRTRALWS